MITTSMAVTHHSRDDGHGVQGTPLVTEEGPESRDRGRGDQRDDDGESQQLVHGRGRQPLSSASSCGSSVPNRLWAWMAKESSSAVTAASTADVGEGERLDHRVYRRGVHGDVVVIRCDRPADVAHPEEQHVRRGLHDDQADDLMDEMAAGHQPVQADGHELQATTANGNICITGSPAGSAASVPAAH